MVSRKKFESAAERQKSYRDRQRAAERAATQAHIDRKYGAMELLPPVAPAPGLGIRPPKANPVKKQCTIESYHEDPIYTPDRANDTWYPEEKPAWAWNCTTCDHAGKAITHSRARMAFAESHGWNHRVFYPQVVTTGGIDGRV
jgi:hypothetical protein